jgi:hypothetical protein
LQSHLQRRSDGIDAARLDVPEHLGEDARGLFGSVCIDQRSPRTAEDWTKIGDELGSDLPHGLGLT